LSSFKIHFEKKKKPLTLRPTRGPFTPSARPCLLLAPTVAAAPCALSLSPLISPSLSPRFSLSRASRQGAPARDPAPGRPSRPAPTRHRPDVSAREAAERPARPRPATRRLDAEQSKRHAPRPNDRATHVLMTPNPARPFLPPHCSPH
jgi:hypothetical protein